MQYNKITLFFIASLYFPVFLCQNASQYAICLQPFHCGRLRNLSYPFWGGSRPPSCGYPGFELNCDGDVPLLNISSLSYRVLDVNFSTFTLTVARQDLWNSTCPQVLHNTTLDPDIFEIPSDSSDGDVTLYYGCAATNRGQQIGAQNRFSCDVGGVKTVNVFDAGSGPGSNITCNSSISVPVNGTAARALETPASSSVNVLRSALASGFFIQWSADNYNCQSCQRSGGTCVYNPDSGWAGPPGMPPVLSPGPKSGLNGSYEVFPPVSAPPAAPGSSAPVGIMLGLILGISAVIASVFALVCYVKRRRSPGAHPEQVRSNKGVEAFLRQHGSLAPKSYKYSEIKKITKSFSHQLGQGGYGTVYKGTLPDGFPVAIKVLTEINSSNGEEFINEVASISRTSHVNIVTLLGFCYDGNKRALVYEFMPNMSLDKFISSSGCQLDLDKLYNIAVGVAKGLEYLHIGCSTRIVHFDIKPQNILLDEDMSPKICDFGLAKLCKKKQSALSLLGARGTIGYIAPEIFSRTYGRVSHKSDVYSYGMMVLEMVGANKTVEDEGRQSSENYFPDKVYELATLNVSRHLDDSMIDVEEETRRKMILVGFWCIQTTPSDRPSMSKVVEMLEGSVQSIEIPPKPVLFTPCLQGEEFSTSLSAYTETENSIQVIADG